MFNRLFFTVFAVIFFCLQGNTQDLPEVVPLSPNAGSIAKYGEVPVGHFTGIPNVSIPLYTVNSGELTLPLSLSYHAGGHKVESIASWVGLGWTLGSIPSISRTVRGIPDEIGFFSNYSSNNYTVWELMAGLAYNNLLSSYDIDLPADLPSTTSIPLQTLQNYRADLFDGIADSEPDIFNYNIPGESGKFFWDQETESFITYPKSNIKITRNGSNFLIVGQDGVEYNFNVTETNAASQTVINSWKASTMVSANKKDSIQFIYTTENQLTKTVNKVVKYHYLGGVTGNGFPTAEGSILNNNLTYAKLPDSIIFSKGYVKFNKNAANREDLNGGRSLNNVSIYNNHNQLITKHQFTYRFKTGTGISGGTVCANVDDYTKKWMLLDKVEQVSNNSSDVLAHSFTYNEAYFPACRISAAQDYWGYYNGYDTNQDLIPTYFINNTSNQVMGANRSVDTSKSDYGILTKITYPTGGYTEFDYENNMAYSDNLAPEYIKKNIGIYADDYLDVNGNMPSNLRSFKSFPFTIDNPQDPVLNNDNPNGGSQIAFTIQFPGCDISAGSNPCALFTMTNIGTNDVYYLHLNGTSFYVPNGTYRLSASFDTTNNDYDNFIFIAEWDEIAPNQTGNKYVGGIRVKEIRNYAHTLATPITKKYKYTTELSSTTSSGDIFGTPNFSHSEIIEFYKNPAQGGVGATLLQRVSSTPNLQQVTHSGAFVGYKKVYEETSNINETGYTEYEFSHQMDATNISFPYPPSESAEVHRGLLLSQKQYKKTSSGFDIVRKKSLEYTTNTFDLASNIPKQSYAMKWGNKKIHIDGYATCVGGCIEATRAQYLTPYAALAGWKNVSKETTVDYQENGVITSVTNHFYDNSAHLLKTRTEIIDSNGDVLKSVISYADEMNNSTLLNQNRVAVPIKIESFDGSTKLSTQNTTYGSYSGNYMPSRIQTSKGTNLLEDRISYDSYYSDGKIKEVSKKDGSSIVYIWGYNKQLPVAKIENATYSQVSSYVSNIQSKSDLDDDRTIGTTGNEGQLRTALAGLRNISGALVTTYTYDPLVGVTSITDPKGYTSYYEYDGFNRLKHIKDGDGKILSENDYHYKGQQ